MIGRLKNFGVSVLEKHPYGYALGLKILESSSIFLPHESDFYGIPLVASHMKGGLFLDVGANRGHSALGFNKIMPGWKVISIEANPLHEARLRSLKAKGQITDYHIIAADKKSGDSVTIWTPRFRGIYCHSSSAVDRSEAVRAIEMSFPRQAKYFNYDSAVTRTMALDELELNPDVIKIDIQGKEVDCLQGLVTTIDRCRPAFLIECNMDGSNIVSFMRHLHYNPYLYDRPANRLNQLIDLSELGAGRNVFFVSDDHKSVIS